MISELTITPPSGSGSAVGTPGELHSIPEALEELRNLNLRGELRLPATVWCRGGVYPVTEPMLIGPGSALPVTFRAAPGGEPVFDGGCHLKDWEETELNGRTVLRARIPAEAVIDGAVHQFHANGRRGVCASWPKAPGVLTPEKPGVEFQNTLFNPSNRFYVKPGDFNPDWYNPQGIEARMFQLWTESHLPVESFDSATGLVTFRYHIRCEVNVASTRYVWQNVREALTEPGEYYFDNLERYLYYFPRPGETAANLDGVVPRTGVLLMLAGSERDPVQNLRFEGLTFRYGGAGTPESGRDYDFPASPGVPLCRNHFAGQRFPRLRYGGSVQASAGVPGVIMMTGVRNCALENCRIEHCNWYGIGIAAGVSGLTLSGNELADLGGGGISACGSPAEEHAPEQTVRHLVITDNHIHDCGAFFLSSVGILLGHVRNTLVEHNHVHDLYYSAISCGWVWGYGDNAARENRIGFNRLHDIGKGMLCDMGGIYMLGVQPGSRIYNNLVYNVQCRFYGGWGIYTDEGSSHIVIENNICFDCSREAFHQHFGRENLVRGNIAAFGGDSGIAISVGRRRQRGYASPGENYTVGYNFFGNVILVDGTPFYRGGDSGAISAEHLFTDLNVLFDLSGSGESPAAVCGDQRQWSRSEWRAAGHDRHSEFADPGFVDARNRDFHLKADSILRQSGFPDPAVTLDQAGVRPLPER